MKILLDLQGAQASGRFRGVGRYSLALAEAMLARPRGHEFHVLLNGRMADSAAQLADRFAAHLPRRYIVTLTLPGPVQEIAPANLWRTRAAELLRESAIAALVPDVVHVSSLFEGIGHEAVTSIGLAEPAVPTAVTLYDLIPLLNPDDYLADRQVRGWYMRKLESLHRAGRLLAISTFSAQEAVAALELPAERVPVIGSGVDSAFTPDAGPGDPLLGLRYGLDRPAVLYAGGGDPRKNLGVLLAAFALLDPALRTTHHLAVVGDLAAAEETALRARAAALGLGGNELRLLGYVPEADLIGLYRCCAAFVFPSLHEGFGLPAAEAMTCGAPVIGSNSSSVPEIIGLAEALFDPRDPAALAHLLRRVLTDDGFRVRLRAHGVARGRDLSWANVAERALDALEQCPVPPAAARPAGRRSLVTNGPAAGLPDLSERFNLRPAGAPAELVLHVTDTPDAALARQVAVRPGPVLLRGLEGTADAVARYREHGLSAVRPDAAGWPLLTEVLTLGQGVILPSPELVPAVLCRYGPAAAAALTVDPAADAAHLAATLERLAADPELTRFARITAQLAVLEGPHQAAAADWETVADSLAANLHWIAPRQILLDITVMVTADVGTGIQRVTRNIAQALIATPPPGCRVELVRQEGDGFVLARDYARRFLDLPMTLPPDEAVVVQVGDLFIGLDLNFGLTAARGWLQAIKRRGADVWVVVYDLLPELMPAMFGAEIVLAFRQWLGTLVELPDALLCISRTVADDLRGWIDAHGAQRVEPLHVGWFHQGTTLDTSALPANLTPAQLLVLETMRGHPSVLAVGTIEPRKGHQQILDAFDLLWAQGTDITLTLVGNRGWKMEGLIARLEAHPECGRRLFWLIGIDDAMLAALYCSADLLLAASYGEGFGLPLIEAAQFGLPVLARDIPVFREVLGEDARYFLADDGAALAGVLADWAQEDSHPRAAATYRAQDWAASAAQLTGHLDGPDGPAAWYLTGRPAGDGPLVWEKG